MARKTETPAAPALERYRVVGRTFVNGSFIDPKDPRHGGKPVYVMLPPGMAGAALEPAPASAPAATVPPGDAGDPNRSPGDGPLFPPPVDPGGLQS